jgi:hypothetical protein
MTAPVVPPAAPVKTEPTDLGVDVPVTTPAWLIKTAAVLVLVAGPFLNWWNPYHIDSSAAKAAIVVVFTAVAGAIFIGQTGLAAIHKYGFTKTAIAAWYTADKDEVTQLVTQLKPIAEQAQPVLAAISNHEPRLKSAEDKLDELRQQIEALPGKQDIVAALKLLLEQGGTTPAAGTATAETPAAEAAPAATTGL